MKRESDSTALPHNRLTPSTQLSVLGYPVNLRGPSYLPRSVQALQGLGEWKRQQPDAPDQWLRLEIATAFQQMVMLKLGQTPAVEMLPMTAEMWVQVVGDGMNEAQDRDRVKAAFKQLFKTLKWWPQPEALLKALPVRKPLPQRGSGREVIEDANVDTSAGVAKFQEIIDMLNNKDREERGL
jgi:hypothetical protein